MVTKNEIKIRMLQKDLTQEKIGETLGVTRPAICRVFNGQDRTPRLRKAIAAALGWPESKLWPASKPKTKPDQAQVA